MSNAERLPQPIDEPEHEAEVFAVDFGHHESSQQWEVEDVLLGGILSDENREFIMQTAELHKESPELVLNSAVESYKEMCELIEAGCTIYILGNDGRMHRVGSGEFDSPDAV